MLSCSVCGQYFHNITDYATHHQSMHGGQIITGVNY